jgi:hypothetical protein
LKRPDRAAGAPSLDEFIAWRNTPAGREERRRGKRAGTPDITTTAGWRVYEKALHAFDVYVLELAGRASPPLHPRSLVSFIVAEINAALEEAARKPEAPAVGE